MPGAAEGSATTKVPQKEKTQPHARECPEGAPTAAVQQKKQVEPSARESLGASRGPRAAEKVEGLTPSQAGRAKKRRRRG